MAKKFFKATSLVRHNKFKPILSVYRLQKPLQLLFSNKNEILMHWEIQKNVKQKTKQKKALQ